MQHTYRKKGTKILYVFGNDLYLRLLTNCKPITYSECSVLFIVLLHFCMYAATILTLFIQHHKPKIIKGLVLLVGYRWL